VCFQAFNHKPNTCPSIDHACKDVRVFSSQGLSGSSRSGTSGLKRARMTPYHFEFPQASSSVAFVSPPGITIITIIIAYQFTRSPQKLTFRGLHNTWVMLDVFLSMIDNEEKKVGVSGYVSPTRARTPAQDQDKGQGPPSIPTIYQRLHKKKKNPRLLTLGTHYNSHSEMKAKKERPTPTLCVACVCVTSNAKRNSSHLQSLFCFVALSFSFSFSSLPSQAAVFCI